jgi:hypothetical protein
MPHATTAKQLSIMKVERTKKRRIMHTIRLKPTAPSEVRHFRLGEPLLPSRRKRPDCWAHAKWLEGLDADFEPAVVAFP